MSPQEFVLLFAAIKPTEEVFAATAFAGLFGGFVRGYSGFGFALAAVPALSLAIPPALAIPAVLPIELAIGLLTLPAEIHRVHWKSCLGLVTGTSFGTPIGLFTLAAVPSTWMRAMVSIVVIVAVFILWRRPRIEGGMLGHKTLMGAGMVSGFLNGGTAMSGPPAIIALLASDLDAASARATLIAFIAFSAAFGIALSLASGLLGFATLGITALMIPTAALGGLFGIWVFGRTPQTQYRRYSLAILFLVSLSAMISLALNFSHPELQSPSYK